MRQKVGIFQDSWAPCDHTHSEPLPLSLLSLLLLHLAPCCVVSSVAALWLPLPLLPPSLSPSSLVPSWCPCQSLLSPRQAPGAKKRRRLAIQHATVSQKKQKPTKPPETNAHFLLLALGCCCGGGGGVPARTHACVRSYVEEAAHELPSYVRLQWRT